MFVKASEVKPGDLWPTLSGTILCVKDISIEENGVRFWFAMKSSFGGLRNKDCSIEITRPINSMEKH
jgi:hypothetical protein